MTTPPTAMDGDGASALQALAARVVAHVEGAKRSIDQEIANYPTPIPRCDAQFNFLYEQRSRLAQWLTEVRDAMQENRLSPDDCNRVLQRFVALPAIIEAREEAALRACVADALAGERAHAVKS